ncbi:MAG TPA: T9SS type A sorting domain-containing protein [Flavobacteriales bacterium]|nr:T9SS type A sorting domain-containing protein [Flavobacteriales bacterium]
MEASAQNDIENVIVETYYISDANDATDTIGGTLAAGSRTYRVFIDLSSDCALRAVYGDANHPLSITSTGLFFNNLDRGKAYGHEVSNSALDENTVPLDSWLSLGRASNSKFGILKTEDTDGSIVGGGNNDGGSAEIPAGLLVNADPDAGLPLTEQDGLVPLAGAPAVPPNFNVLGDDPSTVFGDSTLYAAFESDSTRVGCSTPGVVGPTAENKILIAQLTTNGELSFCINVEVEKPDGTVIHYVASDSVLLAGETANGLLCYPPQCGCTDPNFLEYDPTAGCDDGSCQTEIIFGCLDPLACNYDPNANFNVIELCCYGPENCNGLDASIVCPGVGMSDGSRVRSGIDVFPNPARGQAFIHFVGAHAGRVHVTVHDLSGRLVLRNDLDAVPADGIAAIDVSALARGAYLLQVKVSSALYNTRILVD